MLSGTEADILSSVARLGKATRDQIRREVGFSLGYIGFICRYLIRKGYLNFSNGHYFLAKEGIGTLLTEETPKVDRELLKEIAGKLAREVSGELKKRVKGIRIPVKEMRERKDAATPEALKIKTDFELPVVDESLALESNIDKIGANLEKEKFDIDKSVKLFKEVQKKRRKK